MEWENYCSYHLREDKSDLIIRCVDTKISDLLRSILDLLTFFALVIGEKIKKTFKPNDQ